MNVKVSGTLCYVLHGIKCILRLFLHLAWRYVCKRKYCHYYTPVWCNVCYVMWYYFTFHVSWNRVPLFLCLISVTNTHTFLLQTDITCGSKVLGKSLKSDKILKGIFNIVRVLSISSCECIFFHYILSI